MQDVTTTEMSDTSGDDDDPIKTVTEVSQVKEGKDRSPPILVRVCVEGIDLDMEVDTGASVSLMGEDYYHKIFPGHSLNNSEVRLQTYLGEAIPVIGSVVVNVEYEGQHAELPLVVVKGSGPTLLGRNWLKAIMLNWQAIHYTVHTGLTNTLDQYREVFEDGLGTFQGFEAHLEIDPNAQPRFNKARSIPYSKRQGVEDELDRLVAEGTLEPVEYSDWAAPIVAVLKPDKRSIRICGDFRTTVNPVSKLHRHPIPRVEDLFASLAKGKTFSTIDLKQAYLQMKVEAQSQKYLVINTHRGLFRYTRLPYGVNAAPGIFQRAMEQMLRDIPGVIVYMDDILVTGPTEAEHLSSLNEVLKRLAKAGLRAKKHKCQFMKTEVVFLGHMINHEGIHPVLSKVKAIQEAPRPRNVSELKSYLGLLTYYNKFMPNLSTVLAPLYLLLKSDVKWKWSKDQEKAFRKSKELLLSSDLLIHVHFDPSLPIVLACDASQYGIGAVLAHKMPDGTERPVGYVSRTLNEAEKNYAQLEKEGLALVYGVKKFYSYLFGHSFNLITDHKPLLGLLSECKSTSPQASARVKRWSLYLSMFDYTLTFRNTKAHANADALSRLPLPGTPTSHFEPAELVLLATHLESSPVSSSQIAEATRKDPVLSTVSQYVNQGWPEIIPQQSELTPYYGKRNELSFYDGCLLWGCRVVIPKPYQEAVLAQLHEGHQGIVRTKSLARMYAWWPGIDRDVDRTVRQCVTCQKSRPEPPDAPLHPWSWPSRPWARLHLDYAGPVEGKMVLVMVDAHSKWIEAVHTTSATSAAVMEVCRERFAQFGLPETVVTDNGSCFVGAEFEAFLKMNGIQHITTAPYHPASNGLAERAVQVVKAGLKRNQQGTFRSRLSKTVATHRLTPHATTGLTPCELLLGRRIRTRLDFLRPNAADKVERQQARQKLNHDNRSKLRRFSEGDNVWVRNLPSGDKWISGVVLQAHGNVSYSVRLEGGRVRKCHIDQLREAVQSPENSMEINPSEEAEVTSSQVDVQPTLTQVPPDQTAPPESSSQTEQTESEQSEQTREQFEPSLNTQKEYPRRARVPVERYDHPSFS